MLSCCYLCVMIKSLIPGVNVVRFAPDKAHMIGNVYFVSNSMVARYGDGK